MQISGSKAAVGQQRQAARRWCQSRKENGGSAEAAGRCLQAHGGSSVAAMSGAEGRQDFGGSCYSKAVAAAAAQQWRHLHKGTGGSAEMVAGRQGRDASMAAAGRC
jgi:hypothetical protein